MPLRRRPMLAALAAIAVGAVLSVGSPDRAEAESGPETLTVVATTGMIADTVRRVGGAQVETRALMGPGVDPHAYRQTRSDIAAMTRADIVFWHGLFLEAQMEDFLRELGARKTVIAVAEATPQDRLLAHDDYDDKFDPHIWMVPSLWAPVVAVVRDALTAARPEAADAFAANAAALTADLEAMGAYAEATLASVPAESRVLITAHDAFNYFGDAYGFDVVGIQGVSTESEAGLARITELVDLLVTRRVGAVFVETSVSDRNIQALIEGAAAQGHEVRIGGELFSDAMGPPGTYEGTLPGMLDHNATTVTRALGGDAPERGRLGRLNG